MQSHFGSLLAMSRTAAGEKKHSWPRKNKALEASDFSMLEEDKLMLDPEAETDPQHLQNSEKGDVKSLEQALRHGRLNNNRNSFRMSKICRGLKLRQGLLETTNPLTLATATETDLHAMPGRKCVAGYGHQENMNGQPLTVAVGGASAVVTSGGYKPQCTYVLFVLVFLALIGISLFIINDGLVMIEVTSKVHTLAGLKPYHAGSDDEPEQGLNLQKFPEKQGRRGEFEHNKTIKAQAQDTAQEARSSLASSSALLQAINPVNISVSSSQTVVEAAAQFLNSIHFPATVIVDHQDVQRWADQIEHRPQCLQGKSTQWAQLSGLPAPNDNGVIHLTAGLVYHLHLMSLDFMGQQRCTGGDYYETDLRSSLWRSRPFVKDLGDGSYEIELQVHPIFVGKFFFKVILACNNFECLKQTTLNPTTGLTSKYSLNKLVADLDLEFMLPPMDMELQSSSMQIGRSKGKGILGLEHCKAADFIDHKHWKGRWTRKSKTSNPNCDMEADNEANVLECFKMHHAHCEMEPIPCLNSDDVFAAVGWAYSTHCSIKIFSEDEAWQCLDRKWILWWSDDNDMQKIASLQDLLKSVLGLKLSQGAWDMSTSHSFTSSIYTRPNSNCNERLPLEEQGQQVRISNMWNVDLQKSLDIFGPVFEAYFSGGSFPDTVIMMASGPFQDAPDHLWQNWTDFLEVGPQQTTRFWKETFNLMESVGKHPRLVFSTIAGIHHLPDYNVQLMEMHDRFLLEDYLRANLTLDFRVVDIFDPIYSYTRQYDGPENKQQFFIDLTIVHMLLNAICSS